MSTQPIPTPLPNNKLGTGQGRMNVTLTNAHDSQPVLYLERRDQQLNLSLTLGAGTLTLYPPGTPGTPGGAEGHSLIVRFRPGSLDPDAQLKPAPDAPVGLRIEPISNNSSVAEYRISLLPGSKPATGSTLTLGILGALPAQYLVGHMMRVEVEWNLNAAGASSSGSRTLFLAVLLSASAAVPQRQLPQLEAWIEGDAVVLPARTGLPPTPNTLTVCVRNPESDKTTLENVQITLDLGTDERTQLPPAHGLTAIWKQNESPVPGPDPLSRTLANPFQPGEITRIELRNLMTKAGVALGKRRIQLECRGNIPLPEEAKEEAKLWQRRRENGQLVFGGGTAPWPSGDFTLELTLKTPDPASPNGATWSLLQMQPATPAPVSTKINLGVRDGKWEWGFHSGDIGAGRYLTCDQPLGTAWTLEAIIQWPLPNAGLYNSLFNNTSSQHHALFRRNADSTYSLGAYRNNRFEEAYAIPAAFPPGIHRIAVVCDGAKWNYYIDQKPVGQSLAVLPAAEPVKVIGGHAAAGQSAGPLWEIRIWDRAQIPGSPVPVGVTPKLEILEGMLLPPSVQLNEGYFLPLGEQWMLRAKFQWPLPNSGEYNSVFSGSSLHHALFRRKTDGTYSLGAYYQDRFQEVYAIPPHFPKGSYTLFVVCDGARWDYLLDHTNLPVEHPARDSSWVGTTLIRMGWRYVGSLSPGLKADPVQNIGGRRSGQSAGPLADVALYDQARLSGQDSPAPVWVLPGGVAASSPVSLGPAGSEATLHLTRWRNTTHAWINNSLVRQWSATSLPQNYLVSIGEGALLCQFRAVRLWNFAFPAALRSGQPQDLVAALADRRKNSDPGLLAYCPLDDLQDSARNEADNSLPRPGVSLAGNWGAAPKPRMIDQRLPLEVTIGNLQQDTATGSRLQGGLTAVTGSLEVQSPVSIGGKLNVHNAVDVVGKLNVYNAVEVGGPISALAIDSIAQRRQPKPVPLFYAKNLGQGRYLTCNQSLGAQWTAEAVFQWPLPPPEGNQLCYRSIFKNTSSQHHLLFRKRTNTDPWELGAYWGDTFRLAYTLPADFSLGAHSVSVACNGNVWTYYIDGAKIGSVTGAPAADPITVIGDHASAPQSIGPLAEIRIWSNTAQTPGTATSPDLILADGLPLPDGIAYAAKPNAPAISPIPPTVDRLLPSGTIIMWNGATADIPQGWYLCDGRSLTLANGSTIKLPDLRDKMIRGGATAGQTGGQDSVTLTVDNLPPHIHGVKDPGHSHTVPVNMEGGTAGGSSDNKWKVAGSQPTTTKNTTGITLESTGKGSAFTIIPAYYQLAFLAFYPDVGAGTPLPPSRLIDETAGKSSTADVSAGTPLPPRRPIDETAGTSSTADVSAGTPLPPRRAAPHEMKYFKIKGLKYRFDPKHQALFFKRPKEEEQQMTTPEDLDTWMKDLDAWMSQPEATITAEQYNSYN